MRKETYFRCLLFSIVLCITLFMNADGIQISSYRIVWEGQNGSGELAQAIIPQWYKPIHYRDKVIVLMYHNVENNPSHIASASISPHQLEEQIQSMLYNNFHFISMEQYIDFMLHGAQVPPNAVLITFDDGYETFYTEAYPILKRYDIPATNFVIVSTIDDRHRDGHKKLTWKQMREMKGDGMSFYNHTYNSHIYAAVDERGFERPILCSWIYLKKLHRIETNAEYRARIKDDLLKAELRLQQMLGNTRKALSFPYGTYNKDVLQICKQLDIYTTFTVEPGINQRTTTNGLRVNAGNQHIKTSALLYQMINRGRDPKEGKAESSYFNKKMDYKIKCDSKKIKSSCKLRVKWELSHNPDNRRTKHKLHSS